jgi:hypothetical protein
VIIAETMRIQTVEELRAGEYHGTKRLRLLSCDLSQLPREILDLADSLEVLDLSSNPLSELPDDFFCLCNLKILFLSDCKFVVFPKQLAQCSSLEMVAFRGNGMTTIPEDAFPPKLRWLILTNNRVEALPRSIGQCYRLQKAMLAGNRLTSLPDEMVNCKKLGLLRLSANRIAELPTWLFTMPELAFLSWASNPCVPDFDQSFVLGEISWSELSVCEILGQGASGIISKAKWGYQNEAEVAVKLFKGEVTSDGVPADEMNACIAAGAHPNLIDPIGEIIGHPEGKRGLVLQLIPPKFTNLGLPPTLESCTRDAFVPGTVFTLGKCMNILRSVASAAAHLHERGIAHGDLYAHNVLVDEAGNALLGDFGAATVYQQSADGGSGIERLEVLAFAHLIEDMLGFVNRDYANEDVLEALHDLQCWCARSDGQDRPLFRDICELLWRLSGVIENIRELEAEIRI